MDKRYESKQSTAELYFKNIRKELLDMIPENLKEGNLLELGAGSCNTLIYAKENGYAKAIYGIELCKIENSNQENDLIDNLLITDVEKTILPYKKEFFDVIICGDVLEHLVDPYEMVRKLKTFLKKDGVLIISLPNIREFNTLKTIFFKGDFKYTESGILDKTHLRFFCKKNMINLFEENGFEVEEVISSTKCVFSEFLKKKRIDKYLRCIFKKRFFEEFATIQYYIRGKINNV
jgi:2-polyprenyl-3-methyl-5-hydroxy-6-metoxy-1,4-benzoquinol methylase